MSPRKRLRAKGPGALSRAYCTCVELRPDGKSSFGKVARRSVTYTDNEVATTCRCDQATLARRRGPLQRAIAAFDAGRGGGETKMSPLSGLDDSALGTPDKADFTREVATPKSAQSLGAEVMDTPEDRSLRCRRPSFDGPRYYLRTHERKLLLRWGRSKSSPVTFIVMVMHGSERPPHAGMVAQWSSLR